MPDDKKRTKPLTRNWFDERFWEASNDLKTQRRIGTGAFMATCRDKGWTMVVSARYGKAHYTARYIDKSKDVNIIGPFTNRAEAAKHCNYRDQKLINLGLL